MKILIVGGVAGGASAAARLRRLDERAEIIMFERGEFVSFSNCSLPYYLSGTVSDWEDLLMMTPAGLKKRFNIDVRVRQEVTDIFRSEKQVAVKNLATGEVYRESYDKLILSPGAAPLRPKSVAGTDGENVFTVRDVNDVRRLKEYLDTGAVRTVAVCGGGFIGMEVAENLVMAGFGVVLVGRNRQVMPRFDDDMAQLLHKELMDNGVRLRLGCEVREITPEGLRAADRETGEESFIPAQAVVLALGVVPETSLAVGAGLAVGPARGIAVNHNFQTSDPDIYAVGDAAETYDRLARKPGILTQAGPAQRQARAAADHICGLNSTSRGFIGSTCLRVFGLNAACTGMTEASARGAGIPCEAAWVLPTDRVNIMPEAGYMAFKLVFEVPTGRILGAQAIGRGDAVRRVDVVGTLLSMDGTLEDLKELELCYAPLYGTAKDVVNIAALVGLNLLNGRMRQVRVSEVRPLVESGAYIIDVREKGEFERGHLKGAVNIPLSGFRERLDEVPRDRPVYLHCRTSQRSYYACCQLRNNGWTEVYNISGSFLGICLYEYYRDTAENREPIVTAYNFD